MQNLDLSPVDQILNATSRKFDAELDGCDALVIPTNSIAYGKPLFRVTDEEILLLSADGSVWDQYDMPSDDVVAYIEALLSSIGL